MMSCLKYGKPIVATHRGMFAEILKNGVHGYLIDPEQPPATFAHAIIRFMTNPELAELMGAEVRQLVDRIPTWEDIARSTMRVYWDTRERWYIK
jgi:glycosyltransferase involved in cell wall biosynthesis